MPVSDKLIEHDLIGLPDAPSELVLRMQEAGLSRTQIHGFFVLLGFYGGMPRTEHELKELMPILDKHLPHDRSIYIEDIVGDFYNGYEKQIGEFVYKWGADITFRDMSHKGMPEPIHIVYPRDYGLIEGGSKAEVITKDKLSPFTRLYLPFLTALGIDSTKREAKSVSLIESYLCGALQFQLFSRMDIKAAQQLGIILTERLPLSLGNYFTAFTIDHVDYTKGLLPDQVSIVGLGVGPAEYGQQFWVFQSWLYFRDGTPIEQADEQLPTQWHEWVLANAKMFGETYSDSLLPLSASNVVLESLPEWENEIADFRAVDDFINTVWGYSGFDALSVIQGREYRALLTHVIYSSLTKSREKSH